MMRKSFIVCLQDSTNIFHYIMVYGINRFPNILLILRYFKHSEFVMNYCGGLQHVFSRIAFLVRLLDAKKNSITLLCMEKKHLQSIFKTHKKNKTRAENHASSWLRL